MKNKAWWIVSACVLVLLVGGGLTWWLVRTTKGPSRVGYNAVSSPISETLLLTGRVAQPAQTELGSMVQNTVVEVLVDEGDAVEAGTLLLRLADEEAAARVREADAAVAEAEARLGRVRGVGRRVAGERLRQAKLESDEAIKDFERSQRLFDEGALTEAALDQARQRRDTAKSQSIAATLEAAATGQTGADTAAAAASLARAQAALESAQIGLDRTRIRAPTAGIVLQRLVAAGQVVRPGDPLVRFSGGGALEVRITPDETHLGRLTLGLTAKVVFEAFPRRTLDAKVSHIAPLVDPERGTVEVRLALDTIPTDLSLRPDMTATVEVLLGQADTALVVPRGLVHDLGTESTWLLLARDGAAVRQDVVLGLQGSDAVEIQEGITADDVILGMDAKVQAGDPVRLKRVVPAVLEGQD